MAKKRQKRLRHGSTGTALVTSNIKMCGDECETDAWRVVRGCAGAPAAACVPVYTGGLNAASELAYLGMVDLRTTAREAPAALL
jgi:hypothetical protein